MFTQEVAVVRKLDELSYKLLTASGDMRDAAENIDVPSLCKHLDGLANHYKLNSADYEIEVDQVVKWMVEGESSLAKNLPKFDKLLNAIIAERLKLGDFTMSLDK